jgi:TRAP-type C4-dicarboxylate transport system permease small subunit
VRTARNIAIIALLALAVAALPGGGDAADVVLTALSMAFLVAIGVFAWRLYVDNQLTISTLTDARRGVLYGALGVIALLIAGADEFFDTDGGTLAWIALLALSVVGIVWVWREATTYT